MTRYAIDRGRSKVYAAESFVQRTLVESNATRAELTQDEMSRRLREVTSSEWMRAHHPLCRDVPLEFTSRSYAWGGPNGVIFPPRGSLLCELYLLHELAHCIVAREGREKTDKGHGWKWASTYLALVRRFMGVDTYRLLRYQFKVLRVRYTAPRKRRPLTEEQREALRNRLIWARAAKAARRES